MFSNKTLRISLKIRLAFIYTLLFVISCSLIFIVASYRIYSEINRMGDEELCRIAENVSEWYNNALERQIAALPDEQERNQYPDDERSILENRFPGMVLLTARRQPGSNGETAHKDYFTAMIWYNGNFYECRVRDDGSVYSKQITRNTELVQLRHLLDAMRQPQQNAMKVLKHRFQQLDRTYGRNDFFVVLKSQETNKILFRAGAVFSGLDNALHFDEMPLTGYELAEYRCIYSDIPGLGKLVVGRSIKNRDTLIRQCLMIFVGVLLSVSGVGVAVAWLIARRFIQGIKQTTLAMQSISGGDYSFRIVASPYNDEEIVTLMETFNEMNERTENLLKEIKMMSDNVAHDLRTPLTRISGTVELLLHNRELSSEVRDVCISVLEETLRLKALVNTIMDISRTNAHPDSLKKEPVDLGRMLRNFCDFMLPAFEEHSLYLKTELPDQPVILEADKTMLQRMFANLIENSLKFTSHGGVLITVKIENNFALVTLEDTGCGITPEDMPHIFDRFYRADASRHLAGNGLGLALVKAVVNAHRWTMDVESIPDKGTTFKITMPLIRTGTIK